MQAKPPQKRILKQKQEEKMNKYRQLMRIMDISDNVIMVMIPGIDPQREFAIDRALFKDQVILYEGLRFYAKVNMDAKNSAELDVSDLEFH